MAYIEFSREIILHNADYALMVLKWFMREYHAEIQECSRGIYDPWKYEIRARGLGDRIINVVCREILPGIISITHD